MLRRLRPLAVDHGLYVCVCVFVFAHIYEKLPQKFLHIPTFQLAGKGLVGACIGKSTHCV